MNRPTGCVVLVINLTLGTFCASYCVEHWFHKVLAVWACLLLGLLGGQFIIPAAVLTWILVLANILS